MPNNLFVASRVLQFSSDAAFDMAARLNIRKGRVYRFDRVMLLHYLHALMAFGATVMLFWDCFIVEFFY